MAQVQDYLNQFLNKRVHIVFCAAISRRTEDSSQSMQHNKQILSNFIKGSKSISLASFIFLSTIDVYKKQFEKSITENTPILPNGYYAISKFASENLLKDTWPQLPIVILRLPGIYGKDDKGDSIVSIFVQKIQEGSIIKLTNKGSSMRDYVSVIDLCKIVYHFLQKPCAETYNIATGKSMMIADIVQLIADTIGQEANINLIDSDDDLRDIYISNRKICKAIPNFIFTSMENGIRDHISNTQL